VKVKNKKMGGRGGCVARGHAGRSDGGSVVRVRMKVEKWSNGLEGSDWIQLEWGGSEFGRTRNRD